MLIVVAARFIGVLASGRARFGGEPNRAGHPTGRGTIMNRRIRAVALGATALTLSSIAASVPALAEDEPSPFVAHDVVASGLNNPRQIDQGAGGTLLVAEAGRGGDSCQGTGEERFCFGTTGAITRINNLSRTTPTSTRIAPGLVSGAGSDGSFAGGATGVEDNPSGQVRIVFNGGFPPVPGLPNQIGK